MSASSPIQFHQIPRTQVADSMDVTNGVRTLVVSGGPLIASLVWRLCTFRLHAGNRVDGIDCWLTR